MRTGIGGKRIQPTGNVMEGTAGAETSGKRSRGRPRAGEAELIDSELLAGAFRVFVANGYGGTSMSQIVRMLGISKTTLYSRYPSKAELFRAIIAAQTERLAASAALQVDGAWLSLEMGLRAYANRSLEVSLAGELLEVNRLIHSEAARFPELGEAAAERMRAGIGQISHFISHCAERDSIPCRDPAGIAEVFIAMMRGWYDNVMLSNRPVSAAVRETWVERAVHALVSARREW